MATILRGARLFDGDSFSEPTDVSMDGDRIVHVAPEGAEVVDAEGRWLLPGLIDCHVHLRGPETLEKLASFGVTTGLDMSSPPQLVAALRGTAGVTDIRSPMIAGTSPSSAHAKRMGANPAAGDALIASAEDAEAWVAGHLAQGADYIKVVIDLPGFDQETVDAVVTAAHGHDLKVVAHASRLDAVTMAQRAGVDILTHAPLDRPISADQAAELTAAGTIIVPTLTMMLATVQALNAAGISGPSYEAARASVEAAHAAGMPILAGTDANETPAAPASPPFGTSLHDELELLVGAGLSASEALRAATSVAAEHFGLNDRGRVAVGMRADLLLLDADPLADISAIRAISGVWCGGIRAV